MSITTRGKSSKHALTHRLARPGDSPLLSPEQRRRSAPFILVAVSDPVLHPEAAHAAAATGTRVVEATEPDDIKRWLSHATAVLVDAECTEAVRSSQPTPHPGTPPTLFLAADPGPVDWQAAMSSRAEEAFVLPSQATELLAALGRALRAGAPNADLGAAAQPAMGAGAGRSTVITVLGSSGGAGTSTLAAATARTLAGARGHAALIDAAPSSGGLDLLLGAESAPGPRWPDLDFNAGFIDGAELIAALPTEGRVSVLAAARTTLASGGEITGHDLGAAVESLREAADAVVVDGGVGGVPLALAAARLSDLVVLVVPAEVRAAAAAAGIAGALRSQSVSPVAVLRHRGWSGLAAGDVEKLTECEVIAELGTIPALAKAAELTGLPHPLPKGLTRVVAAVAGEIS